jgi:colicin import membrane protein
MAINDIVESQDTSLILDDATSTARTAAALRAQSELKSRESISSPAAKYKGVADEDAENSLAKAFEEATGTQAPKEGDPKPEIPATGTVTKSPGIPDNPAEPKTLTPAEIEAERAAAAAKEQADGSSTLDDLLKSASETPKEEKVEPTPADPKETKAGYEEHELGSNASLKSRESFANLKKAAIERESAAKARAEAAEARAAAAEAKATELSAKVGVLTPELDAELKELREHRALFARESTPEFKQKYDAKQAAHYDAIYTELKKHQLSDEEIVNLKSMSKAERDANIDRYLGLLQDAGHRRPIEQKLLQIATIEEERNAELEQTKAKAAEVVQSLRTAPEQEVQGRRDAIANLVRPKLAGLDWIAVKDIPAGTPPETKKSLEAHNKFAKDMQMALRSAITDESVETRAVAALSVPLSYHFARELASTKAELAAANAQLEKIRSAGATSRLNARATVKSDVPKSVTVDTDPRDAIDDLFKEAGGNLRG